jgi:hypothetical protein
MFCKKQKKQNIIYHILHVFRHLAKFKLEPLPWEKKNQPATYFWALKRNRFFLKKTYAIGSKLSNKNPHFEHHQPLFAPNNASWEYLASSSVLSWRGAIQTHRVPSKCPRKFLLVLLQVFSSFSYSWSWTFCLCSHMIVMNKRGFTHMPYLPLSLGEPAPTLVP